MPVLSDEEVISRVESPMNLLNRLRSTTVRNSEKEQLIVSIPPKLDDIMPEADEKLAVSSSRARAASVMNKALGRLDNEIASIRGDRLPGVIAQMSNAIKNLEPEKEKEDNRVQFIVYTPTMMKEADFGQVIEVKE